MLFPEPKPDILPLGINIPRRLPDIPRRGIRSAEIDSDVGFQVPFQATHIAPVQDAILHRREQLLEVRAAKVRARLELREGIDVRADAVEVDVGGGVEVEALGEVGVDAEELGRGRRRRVGGFGALGFEAGEEGLEPFEGGGVFADPDELDAAETARRVGGRTEVPDVFEDGRPGSDANASADEDSDFVVEDVFGGGTVRAVDADGGHFLPVLQGHFVHAHRVEGVVFFGLGGACAQGIP